LHAASTISNIAAAPAAADDHLFTIVQAICELLLSAHGADQPAERLIAYCISFIGPVGLSRGSQAIISRQRHQELHSSLSIEH